MEDNESIKGKGNQILKEVMLKRLKRIKEMKMEGDKQKKEYNINVSGERN